VRKVICRPAIIVLMASSDFRTLSLWRCTYSNDVSPTSFRRKTEGGADAMTMSTTAILQAAQLWAGSTDLRLGETRAG